MIKAKKLICLGLTVVMTASLLTGCGKKSEGRVSTTGFVDVDTETEMTLSYCYWQDRKIVSELINDFQEKYPNIKVEDLGQDSTDGYNENLTNLSAAMNLPDVFWLLGECDFAIENGMLYDMSPMWEADEDTKNVLSTINSLKLGYFGTEAKWTTPVKYFPDTIFANKALFESTNHKMPEKDWTWEDMKKSIEEMCFINNDGKRIYGYNDYRTIVTWYPVAADADCVGEFGWDGTAFDFKYWADALKQQADWIKGEVHAPTDTAILEEMYGSSEWVASQGVVAYQFDSWWTWNNLFSREEYTSKNVIYVPYIIPHTADNQKSEKFIATMDFGGISAATKHPREAYEVLKFMTWGAEGWTKKLEHFKELEEQAKTDKTIDVTTLCNNLPLCNDETVWNTYKTEFLPSEGDEFGRGEWFSYYLDHIKEPIPYGGQQIPGFTSFLQENYDKYSEVGVYSWVVDQGNDPHDLVDELTNAANQKNKERLDEINQMLITN